MRIEINEDGRCIALGVQSNYSYAKPENVDINFDNFNRWVCSNRNDINNPANWSLGEPPPEDTLSQVLRDKEFGQTLINKFLSVRKAMVTTPEEDLILMGYNWLGDVRDLLYDGSIRSARTRLLTKGQEIIDTGTRDQFVNEMTQYLGS